MVEYDAEFQAKAVEEVKTLPEGSAVVDMLSDYAVMREQAGVCFSVKSKGFRYESGPMSV